MQHGIFYFIIISLLNIKEHYGLYTVQPPNECNLSDSVIKEIRNYQPVVNRIITEITNGKFKHGTWDSLAELTDIFGGRLTGSQNLEDAIDYINDKLKNAGLENVHTEPVKVPHWVRGVEKATVLHPRKWNLPIIGLGLTVGTPSGGITAPIIVVESFEEFETLNDDYVRGKIVVFVPQWVSYPVTVAYRGSAADVASKKGAVAVLIRSVTPDRSTTLHTGMMDYKDDVPKIPAAAIRVSDAYRLLRNFKRFENITIHLEMNDDMLPSVISRNTIAELQGTKFVNDSVVVVSGHFDSWDNGNGAMDDGGGGFISWKAVEYLKKLGLRPRRTIRAILWTGEEFGYIGAKAYQEGHLANEKDEFNMFFESDMGTFEPTGLGFTGTPQAKCIIAEVMKLMISLNASELGSECDGPDISTWVDRGFPGVSLLNKNEDYFVYHHSEGDTMIVESSESLDKATALFAAASYVIADLSFPIPKEVNEV